MALGFMFEIVCEGLDRLGPVNLLTVLDRDAEALGLWRLGSSYGWLMGFSLHQVFCSQAFSSLPWDNLEGHS